MKKYALGIDLGGTGTKFGLVRLLINILKGHPLRKFLHLSWRLTSGTLWVPWLLKSDLWLISK